MWRHLALGLILVGLLSCATKEPERPAISPREFTRSTSPDSTDEMLEPLTCATERAALPESLARGLDLYFSPTMLDAEHGGWSDADVLAFARMLTTPDAGPRSGILTRVWDYYGPDRNPSEERFTFASHGRAYTRIRVDVYFQDDCCRNRCGGEGCPAAWPDSCKDGGWVECGGYGVYRGGNLIMVSGGNCPETTPSRPEVAAGPVVAHEMAHLSHLARDPFADVAFSEMLAVGAEYLTGERWQARGDTPRSKEYDVSLKSGSEENLRCAGREVLCKYNQFRLWNGYLFAHFSGDADSLDLVYRWIHRDPLNWRGLGLTLLEEPFASRVPGRTAGEKLGNVYHRFAMARYMDAPGVYGFGSEVSPGPMSFFEWPDTLALPRKRVMPPVVRLGPGDRRAYTAWRDPVQPWAGDEPCRVLTTGSDYWILLAEPGPERTLTVRVRGRGPVPTNQSFRLGYASYAAFDSTLHGESPLEVVEDVAGAHAAAGDTLDARFAVPRFGSHAQSVLVVLSMVEEEPSESFWGVSTYDYEIAVSSEATR